MTRVQIVLIVGAREKGSRPGRGESQDMLPRATATETARRPRRRPDRSAVERLLAANPDAVIAVPTARPCTDVDAPGGQPIF